MTIEIISTNTVKIALSRLDMSDYDMDYEKLNRKNPETKRLIYELLEIVKEEKDLDLCAEKLFIEAFPQSDGGCLLYISLVDQKLQPRSEIYCEILCEFENLKHLNMLASRLFKAWSHLIRESELYYNGENYHLIISIFSKTEDKICAILSEFGNVIGKGEILAAATREYYDLIIEEDAIERLSALC